MEENKETELREEVKDKISKKEMKKSAKLEEELKKVRQEADEWKNKYYMAYADTQNTKKLLEKEHSEIIKYRAAGFVENLMPALDSFHCALQIKVDDPKMKNFLVGFEYIYKNLLSVLENEGVTKLEPELHAKFDASYMHALDSEESDLEPNLVLKVLSAGYKLKDRVIKPAMVIVSRKKEEKKENEAQEEVKNDNNSSNGN